MTIHGSTGATPSVVIHVPHASTLIPTDLRPSILLDDAALALEVLRMTDAWTDELFAVQSTVATVVRFPVSRLVVDPERFLDDAQESMAARGMGAVYVRTSDGRRLRDDPTSKARASLLDTYYVPHHAALTVAVDRAIEARGRCLVVDAHSFPSRPLPCEPDPSPDRPDVCLGTDPFHTPAWLLEGALAWLQARELKVYVNRPFAGALVPEAHHRREPRVRALMIEVNRRLYMDEDTGERSSAFSQLRSILRQLVDRLGELSAGMS